MRILSAAVSGFRNLQDHRFIFSPRVNLVLGRNGEGKTNLLESLNFFALGRSHRGSKSDEMIGFEHDALHVDLDVEEESGNEISCEYGLDRSGARRFRIDGELIHRRSDLVGRLATVFFNPDSIRLVQGGPQQRRNFVDQSMSEIDPLFLADLTAFQRSLKQKTGLLRDLKRGILDYRTAREELAAWNRELADHAAGVCLGRATYARLLTPRANDSHRQLADRNSELEFEYRPSLEAVARLAGNKPENTPLKEDLAADILTEIDYIGESEIRRGRPLSGPQMDDFEVRLDELDLRVYGSQGETRTAAISLILARSDVLYGERNVRPVLFFDDIFSELDRERTRRLQEMASRLHQVFIASARNDDVAGWQPELVKTWNVCAGEFTEIQSGSLPDGS